MIYYNIINDKKVFFESDIIFANYEATLANKEELEEYFLEKARAKKNLELKTFYASPECWTFKVFTNDADPAVLKGAYASLTRDADFFAKVIPASLGKTMTILDDKNQPVQYFLDAVKGQNLNYKINNKNGAQIRYKKIELENRINITNNIDDINNIDCKNELLNAVDRNINLDIIK